MAQIAHTVQTTPARVPARIVQAAALPTRQPLVSHVEVPDLPRAMRAQKVLLPVAAKETSIAHHLDHRLHAVDVDGDLAREGPEGRDGCPRDVVDADARAGVDEGARFTWFSADAEGCGGHGGNIFTTGPEGLSRASGGLSRGVPRPYPQYR